MRSLLLLALSLFVVGVVIQAGTDETVRTGPTIASAAEQAAPIHKPIATVKMNTDPLKADQILHRLQQAGFSTEIPWRLSRLGDEWLAQSRKNFGNPTFPNEAEVALLAPAKTGPYTASVEAEIYTRGSGEKDTIDAASVAIKAVWPDVPSETISAFERGRNLSFSQWEVTREDISNNGYIIRIEGSLPANE